MEQFKFRKAEKADIEQLVNMRIEYLKEDIGETAIEKIYRFFLKNI